MNIILTLNFFIPFLKQEIPLIYAINLLHIWIFKLDTFPPILMSNRNENNKHQP